VLPDEEAFATYFGAGSALQPRSRNTQGRRWHGRGVTEIKKLGGALFTESKFGEGVKFTIRLPFTLAISQSLLVRVGELEMYALPLPSVEGVVRLPRAASRSALKRSHTATTMWTGL